MKPFHVGFYLRNLLQLCSSMVTCNSYCGTAETSQGTFLLMISYFNQIQTKWARVFKHDTSHVAWKGLRGTTADLH